jgi:hypothetical protein
MVAVDFRVCGFYGCGHFQLHKQLRPLDQFKNYLPFGSNCEESTKFIIRSSKVVI